jgi:hypothetical protein
MMNQITATIETITPELAHRIWESRNESNRNLSKFALTKYSKDMLAGRWKVGGQGIIFDKTGRLADGHHRIAACLKANTPFKTLVVRGVEPDAVEVLDTGCARQAAHVAQMKGIKYATVACAAARYILLHNTHGMQCINSPDAQPSNAEIIDFITDNAAIQLACQTGDKLSPYMGRAMAAFLFYEFNQRDVKMAHSYFDALSSGANLSESSPILALRKRLMENRSKRAKLDNVYIAALAIKAWNAFVKGRSLKVLKWSFEAPVREAFPKIEGVAR